MAELVCSGPIDLAALREHLAHQLPKYAQPAFLRIRDRIHVTPTFKQMKNGGAEGDDPSVCADPLMSATPHTPRMCCSTVRFTSASSRAACVYSDITHR